MPELDKKGLGKAREGGTACVWQLAKCWLVESRDGSGKWVTRQQREGHGGATGGGETPDLGKVEGDEMGCMRAGTEVAGRSRILRSS